MRTLKLTCVAAILTTSVFIMGVCCPFFVGDMIDAAADTWERMRK